MVIGAIGDIYLADQPASFGFGVASRIRKHGAADLFAHVQETWSACDIVVANLESPVLDDQPENRVKLANWVNRGMPEGIAAMKNAGITLVSLANNHIYDYGAEGVRATIGTLDREGIAHFGTMRKPVHTVSLHGKTAAFLGWSLLPDATGDEGPRHYHCTGDVQRIIDEVKSVRDSVDTVVLALHWGNEYVPQPSQKQQDTARQLLDSGVDILLGHHSHTVQPVELYGGGGLVAYSLGDFVVDPWDEGTETSMVFLFDTDALRDYTAVPVRIGRKTYTPQPDERNAERLRNHLGSLSPMQEGDYETAVQQARSRYRTAFIRHFVRNIFRFRDKLGIVSWIFRRAVYLLRNRKLEKRDPNLVYQGPVR